MAVHAAGQGSAAPAAAAASGETTQLPAASVGQMKSLLFQMQKRGFKEGKFCRNKKSQQTKLWETINMLETGMEVCERLEGERVDAEHKFVDAADALRDWKPEAHAQEIADITPAMLPCSHQGFAREASKSAACIALRSKTMKYCKVNHESLSVLNRPCTVKSKRKFGVGELTINQLSLCPASQADPPPPSPCIAVGRGSIPHICYSVCVLLRLACMPAAEAVSCTRVL